MSRFVTVVLCLVTLLFTCTSFAQQSPTTSVPNLIRYSGILKDTEPVANLHAPIGVTFAIYKQQDGGAPIWMETQNVTPESNGQYSVLLGSTAAAGLPGDLFSQEEERWLGVQVQGQAEQPRVLLVSVPYAFKAHEAETLGGLPVSAFLRVPTPGQSSRTNNDTSPSESLGTKPALVNGHGTTNYVPIWLNPNMLGNSAIYQTGGNVGIGTTTPKVKLDVNGGIQGTSATGVGVTGSTGSTTQFEAGVSGFASAATGQVFGVSGSTNSTTNFATGVAGYEGGATGTVFGVTGGTSSMTNGAAGVNGNEGSATGVVYGVSGGTNSTTNGAAAVNGFEGATTGQVYGVNGATNSTTAGAVGVTGYEGAMTGQVFGVKGGTNSVTNGAAGVSGNQGATTGVVYGVFGGANSASANAAGVSGFEGATTGQVYGVNGSTNTTSANAAGVNGYEGATTGQVYGVNGNTSSTTNGAAGVNGFEGATAGQVYGVSGFTSSTTNGAAGVSGNEGSATGVVYGVSGYTNSATAGAAGVNGVSNAASGGIGVNGTATATTGNPVGVFGQTSGSGGFGVLGENHSTTGGIGVIGQTESSGASGAAGTFVAHGGGGLILNGLSGSSFTQVFSVDAGGNGFYAGGLNVKGTLTKGGGSFKIDHPVDPENKYLSHSFVESPDMMNIYNGTARLNARGEVWVTMPDYLDALNRDFQYVLTALGRPQPYLYIAMKMKGNRFKIAGGKPNAEVSWQVTGIRKDAWANAHRIPVEEDKPEKERGTYLYPELYGASSDQTLNARLQH